MNGIRAFALLCALFFVPSTAFAGGWTQPEGAGYAKVWGTGIFGGGAYDLDGEIVETESFQLVTLSAYGEYGLNPDLTLVTFLQPLGMASIGDQRRGYFGRVAAGFRQRLVDDPLQLAIEARFGGSPGFGGERDMAADAEDYEFRPTVRTYYTEWELQVGVPIGTVGWATASIGPRWSTNDDLSPAVQGFAQLGFGPFAGFVLDVHSTLNHTFQPPEVLNVAGASDTRYLGIGLGVSWWFVDWFAVNVAGDGVLYATSNAAAPALQVGVEFRR